MALTMNDKMGVLISTALNPADIQRIRNQINNLKSQALKKPLALNIDTKNTSSSLNKTIKQTKQMETGLKGVYQQAKSALGKFSLWMGVSTIFFGAVAAIKSMTDAVIRLDTALLEANKVLDLTKGQMALLTEESFKVGEQIGRTGTEVVEATSDWARMGFTMRESLDLAEQSLLFLNIGDGIDSVEQSTKTLIATMKGFGMDAKDVNKIVDILNETSNRFALNTDDIAEGMRRVSAVMNQSGNSIEQTTGLLTAAIEVLQDAPKAATGLRTISQRLRSVGEEGEYLGGVFTAKLQNAFKNIAGVDIMQNGQLRSTYEILIDLSKAWGNLTNEQKQYLGELAAGKRQIQTFLAIMQNGDTIINATETALNSQGSALRENEKYLDSINGRIAVFNSTLEQLWNDTLNSDVIKGLVDFATGLLKVVDAIGLVQLAILVATPIILSKLLIMSAGFTNFARGIAASMGIIGASFATWQVALGGFLVVGAIIGAIALIDSLTESSEELEKRIETLNSDIETLNKELKRLRDLENPTEAEKKQIDLLEKEVDLKTRMLELEQKIQARKNLRGGKGLEVELFEMIPSLNGAEAWYNYLKSEEEKFRKLTNDNLERYNRKYQTAISKRETAEYKLLKLQDDMRSKIKEITRLYEVLGEKAPEWLNLDYLMKKLGLLNEIKEHGAEINREIIYTEEDLVEARKQVTNATDDFQSKAKNLSSVLEDLNNGEKISADTLIDLIQEYPELTSKILESNDSKQKGIDLTNTLWEIEKQRATDKLQAEADILKAQIKNLEATAGLIEAYGVYDEITVRDASAQVTLNNKQEELNDIEEYIEYLKTLEIPDFKGGGSPGTPKEPYIPSIEKYQDLSSALEDINFLLTKNNSLIAQSEGEDKINLLKERVELLKEQQQVMHLLNNARDKEIIQNIEILKQNGFLVDYNKDTNQLVIKNEEHLLNINQKKIKDIEKIIDLVKSLNKENISGSSEWFTIQNEINDLLDEQIDITKELAKVKEDKLVKDSENIVKAETLITQAIKESLNTQKDALEQERNNLEEKKTAKLKELNNEREAAKTKLQIIKDAKDKEFDILIDAKNKAKQALREEFEEDNYQKALKKEQDELLKLEEEYNKIATDNSGLYEKEKLELQEQIAEKRASIQDTILEHGIEKLEDTIDKEIDAIEKQRTQEQEIYDNKLDNLKTFYDDKEDEAERHYNLLIDKAESKIEELESILANESQKLSNQISSMMELTQLEILKFLQDNLSEYKIAGENLAKALLEGYLETLEEAGFDSNLDLGGLNSDVGGLSLNNSGLSGLSGLSNQNNNTQSINVEQLLVQVDQLVEEQDFEGLANKIRNILTSSSRGTSRSVARR
jgi:TP901 family phage tail tape measure protein